MGGPHETPGERHATTSSRARVALRCTYCHDDLARGGAAFCAACLAPHHVDCHGLHGRCAAPGCRERDVVRPRRGSGRLKERPRQPERARRGGAADEVARLGRASLVALGLVVVGVLAHEGAAGLLTARRAGGQPSAASVIVLPAARPEPSTTPEPPPAQARPRPPLRATLPVAELRLVADGLALPLLLGVSERLLVARVVGSVQVYRLRDHAAPEALLVAQERVEVRLRESSEQVVLDGREPWVLDVDHSDREHPRLRRRRAVPDEVRRAVEATTR